MTAPAQPAPVRLITLNHAEHTDSTLYRFKKGYTVRFCPGPSLLGRKVFLYTNYVVSDDPSAEFVRSQYYLLEWRRGAGAGEGAGEGEGGCGEALGAGALVSDLDCYCELRLTRPGPFHYYFQYDNAAGAGGMGSGWLQVEPTLRADGSLPLDGVVCQTVLSKCLGALPRWPHVLRAAREAGYNMLHFTPVQQLGGSHSNYSIANQLRVNPQFGADGREPTFTDVENIVSYMRNEWKMLSICDIVLNHTANETAWLSEHPEATYNLRDCAHLRPAALVDAALARLTRDVAAGSLVRDGVPARIDRPEQVEALRGPLEARLAALHIEELFQCDVTQLVAQFTAAARNRVPPPPPAAPPAAPPVTRTLTLQLDPQRRRLAATVDMELALQIYNVLRPECGDEASRVCACGAALRAELETLNEAALHDTRQHLAAAVDNCLAGVRYNRVQADGPRIAEVSDRHPLVPRYFTWPAEALVGATETEALVLSDGGALVMAHNGWVMGADPLQDFAAREAGGRVYLRRELLAWGDSVKLRYGSGPDDCPFLWRHMRDYVELTAEIFHGVRLDNCHSTPLHVAEYMLDCARAVRPDLYVVAELFTDSPHVDNIFVNRLGITSLIREAQSAWDAHEQGRLLHRFGGKPVGAFTRQNIRPARPRVAHAMLLDLTHDNPSPIQKRSVHDLLPTAALVAAACCATGSTRGYDELVPHHIDVVEEDRLYPEWISEGGGQGAGAGEGGVSLETGIMAAKRALNRLHLQLARDGYSELFVDQLDPDTVAVTRHHPVSRRSVVIVSRCAFRPPPAAPPAPPAPPRDLTIEGELQDVLLEATLVHNTDKGGSRSVEDHVRHPRYITGLSGWRCVVRRELPVTASEMLAGVEPAGSGVTLRWRGLPAGGVLAVRVAPGGHAAAALVKLHAALAAPDGLGLNEPLSRLDLADLHALLYRCDAEERDAGGGGCYSVPGHGPLVFAGLQGAASLLDTVVTSDDLGHALCDNLRAGDWLADYTWQRLVREPRLAGVGAAVKAALALLHDIPRYLQPAAFAAVHERLVTATQTAALAHVPAALRRGLARPLTLTSVQLVGRVPSAPLPPCGPPRPPAPPSLSAGLPHFATGYMRCWGRDTFISLRGLLLLPGRCDSARDHILSFGACLRHGLVPNLLDAGVRARYNCRDAVWWWLYSIKQYCTETEEGVSLLEAPVSRLYPTDDSEPQPPGAAPPTPLRNLVQEALERHFQGIAFRERRAGPEIDAHMTDPGFTVTAGIRPDTGFPTGGNDHNAGTWMDKMGSSQRAGTQGRPATPRDGSAVELVGLCYAVVAWLRDLHAAGKYPHPGVTRTQPDGSRLAWRWEHWADLLRKSFERHFWVPSRPGAADDRPDLVHRRGIYKDTVGATRPWADYQLRCNYVIAMVVAPELFEPRHAWLALENVKTHLLAPLGLKTLDPGDWQYRPNYDNSDDSEDPTVAHGFNYHNGPEWVWPLGFYLRARLRFAAAGDGTPRVTADVLRCLSGLAEALKGEWRGLPELTNKDGTFCPHSCRSQAWSNAVILEVLDELP